MNTRARKSENNALKNLVFTLCQNQCSRSPKYAQDASRARASLEQFVADHDQKVASWYGENADGATLDHRELRRLHRRCQSSGDILLVEAIARVSRLPQEQ